MIDLPDQLTPLTSQLYRRLEFRIEPLRAIISGIQHQCAARGLGVSGAVIKQLLSAFQTETELRLETIERVLRDYRLSCSPLLIIQHKTEIANFLQSFVNQHCQYIKSECERGIRPVINALSSKTSIENLCSEHFANITRTACGLIDGVFQEIVVAAQMDIDASSKDERPNYVYQTTVHGPVGAFAQGGSTVGSVHQAINAQTDSVELMNLVREALSKVENVTVKQASMEALGRMQSANTSAGRLEGYKNLVSSLSDHMTVLTPFLPALTTLLSGN